MGGACNALFQSDRSINSACSSKAYTVPNALGTLNRFPLTQLLAWGGVIDEDPLCQKRPQSKCCFVLQDLFKLCALLFVLLSKRARRKCLTVMTGMSINKGTDDL